MKLNINTNDRIIEAIEPCTTQEMYTELMERFDTKELFAYPIPMAGMLSTNEEKVFGMINEWSLINTHLVTGDTLYQ